jgi:hypothetical protein
LGGRHAAEAFWFNQEIRTTAKAPRLKYYLQKDAGELAVPDRTANRALRRWSHPMPEDQFEVAQIREIVREVGRFGGIMRLLYVAEKITAEDTQTIAMSTEFEWQMNVKISDSDKEQATRKLHTVVLQALLADAWEPIGTDDKGRVMALRRKITQEIPEGSPAEQYSWQITHPWRSKQEARTS